MKIFTRLTIALPALLVQTAFVLSGCASVAESQPASAPVTEQPVAAEVPAVAEEVPTGAAEASAEEGERPNLPEETSYDIKDVRWIQQRLQQLGYYDGAVDGAVGSATRAAVKAYQLDQGLTGDGEPTAELRQFMWRNGG
jgi:hypothetical protein